MVAEQVKTEPAGEDLNLMIEERVRDVVEPVLASFVPEVAQVVLHQVEQRSRDTEQDDEALCSPERATEGGQPSAGAGHEQPAVPVASAAETAQRGGEIEPPASTKEGDGRVESGRPLAGLAHTLGEQAERRLPTLLAAGLAALLSGLARDAIERRADDALHAVVAWGSDRLPDGTVSGAAQEEIEQLVQSILHELLDSIFSGTIRTELADHGQQAIEALLRGDGEAAQEHVRVALSRVADELLAILRRHGGAVLRVAIRIAAAASGQAVAVKAEEAAESAASPAGAPVKAIGTVARSVGDKVLDGGEDDRESSEDATAGPSKPGKTNGKPQGHSEDDAKPLEDKVEDKGEDLRDQLADIADTLRQQVEEGAKGLKQNVTEGIQSGTKEGSRNRKFGHPPSPRPPTGGRALGRPPGRPPSGRPPSR